MSTSARTKTGIPGLDEAIEGGLLRNSVYSIVGAPGTGKTIMASQFIFRGATQYAENGVYASLEEQPRSIASNMMAFNWNLFDLESQGKLVLVDGAPYQERPGSELKIRGGVLGSETYDLDGLLGVIAHARKRVAAKRCVIDSLDFIRGAYKSNSEFKFKLLQFFRALSELELTTVVLTDAETPTVEKYGCEAILASGCFVLRDNEDVNAPVRMLEIRKSRGIRTQKRQLAYMITPDGIEVKQEPTR